jgi:pyruvate dehydrogenase E2 component (dihydrolipoamide acetyltransferase)
MAGEGATVPVGSAVAFIYGADEEIGSAPKVAATPAAVEAPAAPAAVPVPSAASPSLNGAPRATPLARRLAREKGIALASLTGSGPRGRIVAADVVVPAAALLPAASAGSVQKLYAPGSFDVLPLDNMRRTIAERLTQAKQTVPHFYLSITCDVSQLWALRERLNALAPLDEAKAPLWKLSINDFVIKALGLALKRVPRANVTWANDSILQHRTSDIGVAVAVDDGLFTPMLRAVEGKTLSQLSIEMKALAAKARARKLAPADYQGGTSAISNLGMYGIEEFSAIINPPQATILAVGATTHQFVPVNGQPVLKPLMKCTLSCDHRAVDGALGAQLLSAFRSYIEEPALMLA